MITIEIERDKSRSISGFTVRGHSGTAPRGQDIVCAGVSALTQTAVLGLNRHLKRELQLDIKPGLLALVLQDAPDVMTDAILETMLLGLNEIAKSSSDSVRILEHRR
ncbi:ribosomal-processing cysteine protease Prp [Azotosporobacter soli]|uniref:ribosomal-processing cysteine protease Prp n=1 Tax=Azotosporobacter soli TaxID=3055040 RepID=UPI0031FE71C2